jgi:hypothetical protein
MREEAEQTRHVFYDISSQCSASFLFFARVLWMAVAEEEESESNFTPYLNETMPSDNNMAG